MVNTPDCGSGMRRFEPDYPPHLEDRDLLRQIFFVFLNSLYILLKYSILQYKIYNETYKHNYVA